MSEEKDIQKGTGRSDGNTESHQLRACRKFFDMRKDERAGEMDSRRKRSSIAPLFLVAVLLSSEKLRARLAELCAACPRVEPNGVWISKAGRKPPHSYGQMPGVRFSQPLKV